jgi:hypothetical protein
MNGHVVIFSINNWLACGIGFAFAGSIVLAWGLIGKPKAYAARVIRSGNGSYAANVQVAENRADAQVGILALVAGFAIQAVTTVIMTGHASTLSGGWSYLVTAAWVAIPVILVWILDRRTRWYRVRSFLLELAHYQARTGETRQQYPDAHELTRYGWVLKEGRERKMDEPLETDEDYLGRVWHLRHKHARIRS